MSFSNNWGHLKYNLSKLKSKIDLKQHKARNTHSPPALNAAARNRKRISLVAIRNREMRKVRLVALVLMMVAIALLYYLNTP